MNDCVHGKPLRKYCHQCMKTDNSERTTLREGMNASYELSRLVDVCEQLIKAASGDAGNVPKTRAPWVVLCNAVEYYRSKGV